MKTSLRTAAFAALAMVAVAVSANPCEAGHRGLTRSSYGTTIAQPTPSGQIKSRYVYRGYKQGFPTPAIFYFGYPHSGATNQVMDSFGAR